MKDITAAELTEIISNKGARTVLGFKRLGVNNALALASSNPNWFNISDGCGPSPVISLNANYRNIPLWGFKHGVACGMTAMAIVFIFIFIMICSNKNV